MGLWHIAWGYLWDRKFITFLTVLSVALGVALISSVLTLRSETEKRFVEEGQAFDIVIGYKGSPLTLVLSTVYYMTNAAGRIPYSEYEKIKAMEDIDAFPISLGDTVGDIRIVGTNQDLMKHTSISVVGEERTPFALAEGRYFEKPFEVVIGSVVAKNSGLKLNSEFAPDPHGIVQHDRNIYKVVGILKPSSSPNDYAMFCDHASIWLSHEHEEEEDGDEEAAHNEDERYITAVLVKLPSPAWRAEFVREFDDTRVMAAIPINEIQKMYNQFIDPIRAILMAVGYLVVVVSSISIMIGLYMSILQRRRDMAIMRAIGASRADIFGSVVLEAIWVTAFGIAAGWLLGNVSTWLLGRYLSAQYGLQISAFGLTTEEIQAYAAVALVGYLAGIVPAVQAYRRDVARDLAEL